MKAVEEVLVSSIEERIIMEKGVGYSGYNSSIIIFDAG